MSPSLRMRTVVLAVVAVASQASLASMTAGEPKSAISMLQEVEEQARSGGKPAFKVVQQIVTMIELIKVDLKAAKTDGVTTIGQLSALVTECTKASTGKITTITDGIEPKVDEDRQKHKTCRDDENSAVEADHTTHKETCEARDDFLKETITESSKLKQGPASTRDAKVDYVESMSTLYCDNGNFATKGKEAEAKEKACTAAETALRDQVETHHLKCRAFQATFENAFCTWRDEVVGNCDTYDTCYSGKNSEYTKAKEELLDVKVAKWKGEMVACEKILCYCDVWQKPTEAADTDEEGAARSKIDANQAGHCSSTFEPDAAEMAAVTVEVGDWKAPDDKIACDATAVAKYPGTDDFKSDEYKGMTRNLQGIDDVKPMIHCINAWTKGQSTQDWLAANPAILAEDKDESAAEGSMGQDNTLKRLMRRSPPKPIAAVQLDAQGGYARLATPSSLEDMEVDELMGKMNELMDHINSPGTRAKDVKTALAKSIESLQGAF